MTTFTSETSKINEQTAKLAEENTRLSTKDTMPQVDRGPFDKRFNIMRDEAVTWQPAWTDLQRYVAPTRGIFWGTGDKPPNQGLAIDHKLLLDGHATRALNTLASGMTSGLTSPTRPWFRLGVSDPDLSNFEPVKEWLDFIQKLIFSVYSRSNIYGSLNSIYQELGGFGTGGMALLEDYRTVVRSRTFTIGEYFLGTGHDGRVNAFARRYKVRASQLIGEFGMDAVSARVKAGHLANSTDEWITVRHLCELNDRRSPDVLGYKGKQYRSAYWEETSPGNTFLRLSGYDEFPILGPRWDTTTTADIYGRGPGWHALGDVKMLQKMQKDKLMALDKVVNPPLQADANVADDVNALPGGITRSSAITPNAGLRPAYQIQPDFSMIENSIKQTKADIDAYFYADLFMMIAQANRPDMTAREIVERHEEKLLMLGPVLERLESELLDPLIDRTFNIMMRAGLIPPPPQELSGMDLKVEYVSLLAQAQKMVGVTAIDQYLAGVGNVAGVFPYILDRVDADEAMKQKAEMLGLPPKIVRSDEAVQRIRDQKQQQAEADAAAQRTAALVDGAKTLSDTKLGQNSALDAIAGNQPAPQP